jgi:toxin-antitoxin system PIN domain toxin
VFLPDVNVLVYAYRADAPDHDEYRAWLQSTINGAAPFAVSELVLSGFLRVVTHPRVFATPSPLQHALGFVEALLDEPGCTRVSPGRRHWRIFAQLCRQSAAKGNLIPDAYLAALAIEHGCEWVTTDGDYARFAGLRWRHPLRPA